MSEPSDSRLGDQTAGSGRTGSSRWLVFLRGSALSMTAAIIIGVLNYLIRRLLSSRLSEVDYGFFYGAMALVLFVAGLLDIGTRKSLTIMMSKALADNDRDLHRRTFSAGLLLRTVGGLVSFAALAAFSGPLLKHHFNYDAAPWVLPSIFSLILLLSFGGTYGAYFSSVKSFFLADLLNVIRTAITIVAGFLLIDRYGLNAVAVIFPAAATIGILCIMPVVHVRGRFMPSMSQAVDKKLLAQIIHFSKWIAIPIMGLTVMFQMDTICLTWLDSLENVARYNIALPIMQILQSIMIFPMVFTPIVAEMWQRGAKAEISAVCRTMIYALLTLIGPMIAAGILFGERIIALLFDDRFVDVKWPMVILWVGMIFLTIANFLINALSSGGREKTVALPVVIAAITNVTLNVVLIPIYGVLGAAMATAAAYVFLTALLLRLSIRHIGKVVGWDAFPNLAIGAGACYLAYLADGSEFGLTAKLLWFVIGICAVVVCAILISPSTRREFVRMTAILRANKKD